MGKVPDDMRPGDQNSHGPAWLDRGPLFVLFVAMCLLLPWAVQFLHSVLFAVYMAYIFAASWHLLYERRAKTHAPGEEIPERKRRVTLPSADPFSDSVVEIEETVPPAPKLPWKPTLWMAASLAVLLYVLVFSWSLEADTNRIMLAMGFFAIAILANAEIVKYNHSLDLHYKRLQEIERARRQRPQRTGPQAPAPLKQRMARYLHCDQEALGQPSNEPPKSHMPFWSAVRLRQYRRRRIKSEWWIRQLLLHIQKLVHGS